MPNYVIVYNNTLGTDFRIDSKTMECPTLTGRPPLVNSSKMTSMQLK